MSLHLSKYHIVGNHVTAHISLKKTVNIISVSNGLDPDHSVGPDLGPNHLQRLSADDKGKSKIQNLSHL